MVGTCEQLLIDSPEFLIIDEFDHFRCISIRIADTKS